MSKQEILQQSGLHTGISYFGMKKSEVEARLNNLPAIRQVKVMKQFPNAISIQVVEYPVVAYMENDHSLIPLLANGATLISHPVTSAIKNIPVFEGWGKQKASFPLLTKQFVRIPATIRSQVITIRPMVDKPEEVSILTRRQHLVEVRIDQLAKRMILYPRFLKQPPGTLHLLDSVWFTPQH
jgi:cell division protein FtsQ